MKKNLLLLIVMFTVALFAVESYGQTAKQISQDYKGNYNPILLKQSSGSLIDSSIVIANNFEAPKGLFYFHITSINNGDSVKSAIIQGSVDKVNWYNLTTFTCQNTPTFQRIVVNDVDRYIRAYIKLGGATAEEIVYKIYYLPHR